MKIIRVNDEIFDVLYVLPEHQLNEKTKDFLKKNYDYDRLLRNNGQILVCQTIQELEFTPVENKNLQLVDVYA